MLDADADVNGVCPCAAGALPSRTAAGAEAADDDMVGRTARLVIEDDDTEDGARFDVELDAGC